MSLEPSKECNGHRGDRQQHPLNCVDWHGARKYCGSLGRRISHSMSGGSGRRAAGPRARSIRGERAHPPCRSVGRGTERHETCVVSRYVLYPQGIHDLSGSLYEWTTTAKDTDDSERSLHGCSYRSDDPRDVVHDKHNTFHPDARSHGGFSLREIAVKTIRLGREGARLFRNLHSDLAWSGSGDT